jgi:hypothetical protein
MFLRARDLSEVELHVATGVVVDQQVVSSSRCNQTVVFGAVLHDDALIRHSLEVGKRKN